MSQYKDNQRKFVAVLNKKIELPKLLNALGHIAAGIASLAKDSEEMNFLEYMDADGGSHPAISEYPFIILRAKNGNQLRTLRNSAIEQGIIYNDFTDTMLGFSAEHQLEQTKTTEESNLDYFAVVLFGDADKINILTKKFSLFR